MRKTRRHRDVDFGSPVKRYVRVLRQNPRHHSLSHAAMVHTPTDHSIPKVLSAIASSGHTPSPHNTRESTARTGKATTDTKVLHGHNRPRTRTIINAVLNNLSSHLRLPLHLADEQLILNVPANSLGSEPSTTTKIPRHREW